MYVLLPSDFTVIAQSIKLQVLGLGLGLVKSK